MFYEIVSVNVLIWINVILNKLHFSELKKKINFLELYFFSFLIGTSPLTNSATAFIKGCSGKICVKTAEMSVKCALLDNRPDF